MIEKNVRVYLNDTEVKMIAEVVNQYDVRSLQLIQDSSSGIGSITTIEFDYVLDDREVVVRVPITTEVAW